MESTLEKGLWLMVQIGCTSVVAPRMVRPEGVAEVIVILNRFSQCILLPKLPTPE